MVSRLEREETQGRGTASCLIPGNGTADVRGRRPVVIEDVDRSDEKPRLGLGGYVDEVLILSEVDSSDT